MGTIVFTLGLRIDENGAHTSERCSVTMANIYAKATANKLQRAKTFYNYFINDSWSRERNNQI